MKARKRFGQHFLHDPRILDRIARGIAPRADDALVEIGPGRGALTRVLLNANPRSLDAIEIDRDLVPRLQNEFAAEPRFAVHEADALDFDFTTLARQRGSRLRIVGNLPYNISTPLLFRLLKHVAVIDDMHVMLQREVVNRIAAEPGNGDYGRLTVMLSPWLKAEALFEVGPGAFQPPPKVWSAVVRLTVRREPAFTVSPHFAAVVASAFSHRRKTLRNALKGVVSAAQIESAAVDPNARPETIAPEAFNRLAQSLA